MTSSTVEITMRIPLPEGRFETIVFDGPESCSHALQYVSSMCADNLRAPLENPIVEWRRARHCSLAPLKCRKSAQHLDYLGEFSEPDRSQNLTIQEELKEISEVISCLASFMARIDSLLAPSWAEDRELRDAIAATYTRRGNVIHLNLDRANERAPLFARLMAISHEWGKLRGERREFNTSIKALVRHADHLRKILQKNRKAK